MGFATSTIPLESNTGYIHSEVFSYPVFSEWFDKVKLAFANEDNFSELKSDRVEAIYDTGNSFASITFSEKGFEYGTRPSVLVRTDNGTSTSRQTFVLPEKADDETVDELTQRWVQTIHDAIPAILSSNRIRARWFQFGYNTQTSVSEPPKLFPPTT